MAERDYHEDTVQEHARQAAEEQAILQAWREIESAAYRADPLFVFRNGWLQGRTHTLEAQMRALGDDLDGLQEVPE